MKHHPWFLLSLLVMTGIPLAQPAPLSKPDSAAAAAKQTKSTDEELILDNNDKSILPSETKKSSAPIAAPAVDTARRAPVKSPIKTAVTAAADTGAKEQPQEKTSKASASSATSADSAKTPPSQPKVSKAAASQTLAKDTTAKKIRDEDLSLDEGDEDLLSKEKAIPVKTPSATAPVESQNKVPVTTPVNTGDTSARQTVASDTGSAAPAQSGTPASAAATVTTVEKVRSVDFSRSLKEYRSPKLAMLMSLILPGSGQVYATSNLWAAGFVAVEATIIGTGIAFSSKSKTVKNEAHAFADKHYDAKKFENYTTELDSFLVSKYGRKKADTIYQTLIFFEGSDKAFLTNAGNKNDDYYTSIGTEESPFIRGWDDVRPDFSHTNKDGFLIDPSDTARFGIKTEYPYRIYLKPDTSNQRYGYSDNQIHYNSLLNDARNWAKYSRSAFISLIVNHIASAVMAGIEAKRHNDELLGKESVWHRLELEPRYVYTGSETVQGYCLGVRF